MLLLYSNMTIIRWCHHSMVHNIGIHDNRIFDECNKKKRNLVVRHFLVDGSVITRWTKEAFARHAMVFKDVKFSKEKLKFITFLKSEISIFKNNFSSIKPLNSWNNTAWGLVNPPKRTNLHIKTKSVSPKIYSWNNKTQTKDMRM